MAVKNRKKQARASDIAAYWQYFRIQVVLAMLVSAIVATGLMMAVVAGVLGVSMQSDAFWVGLVLMLAIVLLIEAIALFIVLKPTRDMNDLIVKLSNGDKNIVIPRNKVMPYSSSGYDKVLKFVYDGCDGAELTQAESEQGAAGDESDFLSKALDTLSVGIVVMDHDRKIIYSNDGAPITMDEDGVEALDLQFDNGDTIYGWLDGLEAKTATKAERFWQRLAGRIDDIGKRKYYDLVASFNAGYKGETVVVIIDQTAEYKPEEDGLNFIAFAAHELRGPITIIRGYLDVLSDELADSLTPEYRRLFDRLVVSSNRLSGYINNILNASRYDQRHLQLILTEETIKNIFAGILDDIQLRASSQQRILNIDLPDGLPTVAADASSIGEVFTNLIDNAIKYSYEGSVIEVKAAVEGPYVKVDVVDHGIGMPPSVVANLFRKFYRSHRSRETASGSGIGLYISQAIVESHGGKILVDSKEGDGTTFAVMLPIYAKVADTLKSSQGDNTEIIKHLYDEQIKNHGESRII